MKYIIASDIHGSALYCGKLLEAYAREQGERLILLGDLLYHGPRNPLPEGYDPKSVFAMLNEHKDEIIAVRGNCDSEVDQMVLEFPMMADYALLPMEKRHIFVTHGHLFNTDNLPPMKSGDILLHGHTHVNVNEKVGEMYYFNPGSISLPKDGTKRGYILLDGSSFEWKTLDGETYMTRKF